MKAARFLVLHCGTNNIDSNKLIDIAEGILSIANYVQGRKRNIYIIIAGQEPRDQFSTLRRQKLKAVNELLDSFYRKINKILHQTIIRLAAFKWNP